MKTFTIENETSNITIHATRQEAEAVPGSECFGNEAALAKLAANWPTARLVEIWNSLPGETPVKKFKDRATSVSRIWKAIQRLGQSAPATIEEPAPIPEKAAGTVLISEQIENAQPEVAIPATPEADVAAPVAPQTPHVASEKAAAKTTRAKRAKKTPVAATKPKGTREGSKIGRVIEMLKREGGVTLTELMAEMGWQQHTMRALMSAGGSLAKKHGLTVVSTKGESGERTYSLPA
jgi:hypothetical protein